MVLNTQHFLDEGFREITDEREKVPIYQSAKEIIEYWDSVKGWRVWVK